MVWRGVEIKNATIRPCLVRPLTDWCLFGVFVSWWRKLFLTLFFSFLPPCSTISRRMDPKKLSTKKSPSVSWRKGF